MPTKLIRKQFLLSDEENERLELQAEAKGLSVSNLTRVRHGLKPLDVGRKSEKAKASGKPRKALRPK